MIQLDTEMTEIMSIRMEHIITTMREKTCLKKQQFCVQVKWKACETGTHNAA